MRNPPGRFRIDSSRVQDSFKVQMSRRTRTTRRHPLSSDEEVIQEEVDQQQSLEVAEERIDVPDDDSQEAYRPSSPGYEERSATPKSQNKSPSVAASRGGSPDAGSKLLSHADSPREEVPVNSNKFMSIPSSALEASIGENIIVDNPEGQSDMNSPHPKAGGSDDVAGESRRDRIQRLNREMQALIDQEDDD